MTLSMFMITLVPEWPKDTNPFSNPPTSLSGEVPNDFFSVYFTSGGIIDPGES